MMDISSTETEGKERTNDTGDKLMSQETGNLRGLLLMASVFLMK